MSTSLSPEENALLPAIEAWISSHREQLIAELAEWIAVPSISRADLAVPGAPFGPACAEILEKVLSQATAAGFHTENHQGYAGSVVYGEHPQDIGVISHLDVVPPGDNWTYPPFTLSRHHDFLIGCGVADNKGPAILDLYLLKLIRDLAIPLHHNLRIVYGLAEETTMADLAWFAQNGPVPDVSIVTDGKFPVNNAQKGQLTLSLHVPDAGLLAAIQAGTASNSVPEFAQILLPSAKVVNTDQLTGLAAGNVTGVETEKGLVLQARGNGGHAAFPDGTLNAVRVLLAALLQLDLLSDTETVLANQLDRLFGSPYGESAGIGLEDNHSGKLTLNAGIWTNAAPNVLSITCDIRYPVSFRGEQVLERFKQHLSASDVQLNPQWRDVPPFFLPEENEIIQLLQQSWNDITRREDRPYSMGGVTHSKVLPNAITFGPGYIRTAENTPDFLPQGHGLPHGADEATHLPSLLAALPHYVIALIRLDQHLYQKRTNR